MEIGTQIADLSEDAQPMDALRFDDLARALFDSASRRALFGLGAAGVLAGLGMEAEDALAKNKRKRRKKKRKVCRKCKRGKCKPKRDGAPCGETCHACQDGRCVVDAGGACGSGRFCLGNAICANDCVTGSTCPAGCPCSGPNTEGFFNCLDPADPATACIGPFQECSTSADCPPNKACFETACGGGIKQCYTLCPA